MPSLRTAILLLPALVFLLGVGSAEAACPSDVAISAELSCSSNIDSLVDHEQPSYLGGDCADGLCYSCGDPWIDQDQLAPEAVYSFWCQVSGQVTLQVTNLTCDLDIYVLDSTCDPFLGCVHGSTAPESATDSVTFTCTEGETYYVVVEAYGAGNLGEWVSGPCTDDGTWEGDIYDPEYTLGFDVGDATGCPEDCDDEIDNDLNGFTDCEDQANCWSEDLCCDTDHDDAIALGCGGDDCDDTNPDVYPGAPELDDGLDNDCDGDIDEGTDSYDDDGDGFTEDEGDCDDSNPDVHPDADDIPDNGIDEDCDGEDAEVVGDDDDDDDDDDSGDEPAPPSSSSGEDDNASACDCGGCQDTTGLPSSGNVSAAGFGFLLFGSLLGLRRRR